MYFTFLFTHMPYASWLFMVHFPVLTQLKADYSETMCIFMHWDMFFQNRDFSWLTHFMQGLQSWGFSVQASVSFNITSLDENQWSISLIPENRGPLLMVWGEGRRYTRYGHPIHFPTVLLSFVSCPSMALCFSAFFFLSSFPWHPWQLPWAERRGCKTHMQMKFWI